MNSVSDLLLVAIGGGAGALLRGGIDTLVARLGLAAPLATLSINLLGSFFAGIVAVLLIDRSLLPEAARPLLLIGLLGGFTTFSAFTLQLARMSDAGEALPLLAYAAGSLLLGFAAAAAGMALGRAL
jgi:CrcB protein